MQAYLPTARSQKSSGLVASRRRPPSVGKCCSTPKVQQCAAAERRNSTVPSDANPTQEDRSLADRGEEYVIVVGGSSSGAR
jgi:hypothetical protein